MVEEQTEVMVDAAATLAQVAKNAKNVIKTSQGRTGGIPQKEKGLALTEERRATTLRAQYEGKGEGKKGSPSEVRTGGMAMTMPLVLTSLGQPFALQRGGIAATLCCRRGSPTGPRCSSATS